MIYLHKILPETPSGSGLLLGSVDSTITATRKDCVLITFVL